MLDVIAGEIIVQLFIMSITLYTKELQTKETETVSPASFLDIYLKVDTNVTLYQIL
jgi:hypothetical protein